MDATASTSAKETSPIIQRHPTSRSYGAVSTFYNFLAPALGTIYNSQTLTSPPDPVLAAINHRTIVNFITDEDIPGLQSLLQSGRVNVDDRDENGTPALHVAASRGKIEFVSELLNFGAEVNAEDLDSWSALLCAAKEGHAEVCNRLLDAGADIEHRDMGGWTALLWACYKGRTEAALLLLARNADVHAQGNYNISSLIWAAGRGHSEIVRELLEHGAKAVTADKCGTSALVWASRNGNPESVSLLLKAGANVDAVGMYSWTALLVATDRGHFEAVSLLLKAKANVNVKDKDGCTALSVASKEGFDDIVNALLNEGAYINVQDRAGDTSLIHAVKGGHRTVVEALLKKYADADIPGKDHKTALYWAVEKGNAAIVKLLLTANPDLEVATKDCDTALLKAVRNRNVEIAQLLMDKKAKVTAADKRGDTCLHIAMRARSKAIVEVLLRNPKHSQLLYRPNKDGETPYNLDMKHNKTILGQLFGQRRFNSSAENEKLLGYDLYGTAIADTLSEPFLTMPIIVGMFAKWGSGKSFLLNKLKDEMKGFARQWVEPTFSFTPLLFLILMHFSLLLAVGSGLAANSWIVGTSTGFGFLAVCYLILFLLWYGAQRFDWYWPYNLSVALAYRLARIKLVLQVLFCHPALLNRDNTNANPIRFYFSDHAKVSTPAGRESCLLHLISSLYDSLEKDYGTWAPRLYRAFRPEPVRSSWQWRRLCCLPYCVIWLMLFTCALLLALGVGFWLRASANSNPVETYSLQAAVITLGLVISVAVVANLFTVGRAFQALVMSQKRTLSNSLSKNKGEGFIHQLRTEVNLMTSMVECLDSFSEQQTRLVAVVDGLDSAEQDKVLQIMDAVSILFNEPNAPFIVLLAIDPHIIARAVDSNSQRVFTDGPISGHSYVRNLVHLPFFLQNAAVNRAKVAQQWAARRQDDTVLAVSRRLSSESGGGDRLKAPSSSRKGSTNTRRLWSSESVASSLASNLNRVGMGVDANKGMMLTDDYFSDVNPKSLRRLMNVMHITVRLLRSFQIEVSWYHVSIWINLVEQWPYRLSWMMLYMDAFDETLEDTASLRSLYEKVKPYVPASRDTEPLLELDADEKKLEIFLANHRSNLLVCHMRLYLPFTINLDPYLKKVIKEENVGIEELFTAQAQQDGASVSASKPPAVLRRQRSNLRAVQTPQQNQVAYPQLPPQQPPQLVSWPNPWEPPVIIQHRPPIPMPNIHVNPEETKLSGMSVDGFCDFLNSVDDLSPGTVTALQKSLKENNIGGKVLALCELNELKQVVNLNFGDWEIFKWLVMSMRQQEATPAEERNPVRYTPVQRKSSMSSKQGISGDAKEPTKTSRIESRQKQTMLEKQVSMEEQMISKALRTLSEEASEDVPEEPGTMQMMSNNSPAQIETPGTSRRLLRPSEKNKRPVSLLVAAPQEELLFPEVSTPPASPRRISALRRAVAPAMTPASSLEKIKDRLLRARDHHDDHPLVVDESTPLVSEATSPVSIIPVTIASPPSTVSSASSAMSLTSQTPEQPGGKSEGGDNLPETQV